MKKRYKYFYLQSFGTWMIVQARREKAARAEGVKEWGRRGVRQIRIADESEVEAYAKSHNIDPID